MGVVGFSFKLPILGFYVYLFPKIYKIKKLDRFLKHSIPRLVHGRGLETRFQASASKTLVHTLPYSSHPAPTNPLLWSFASKFKPPLSLEISSCCSTKPLAIANDHIALITVTVSKGNLVIM